MNSNGSNLVMNRIMSHSPALTPKERLIGDYILNNPRKAVFMTANELSDKCKVSQATVVRFVKQLGYKRFGDFLQSLRDYVDSELNLIERADLSVLKGAQTDHLGRAIFEEIDNLKLFFENVDRSILNRLVEHLNSDTPLYVVGSRITFPFALYFGWSLAKVRERVHILCGSDSTTIDWLAIAPVESCVIIITTSRYPNELIRLGKIVKRQSQKLILIADSSFCPLIQFADLHLIAPSRHIPFIGSPTTIMCIINYLVMELANRRGRKLKAHYEKLEKAYLENDILFNFSNDPLSSL